MLSSIHHFISSNKKNLPSDIKEFQKFCQNLLKEEKKSQKVEQGSKSEIGIEPMGVTKEINGDKLQEQVFKWLSNLSLEERNLICVLSDKCLINLFCQLIALYNTKYGKILFSSTEEMNIFFEEKAKEQNVNASNKNNNFANSKKEYKNVCTCKDGKESESMVFNYKKYFTDFNRNEPIKKDRRIFEDDLLKQIFFVSGDESAITISQELLSDFEKLKKIFKLFSNDNCFKYWPFPKIKDNVKYFLLPPWMSKTKNNLDICQIFLGFLETHILSFYEYFCYTNRIYQKQSSVKILKLYKEINNKIEQLNDNKKYLLNIFSKDIIYNIANKVSINKENNMTLFNELNDSIKNIDNEKQKIKSLLKQITFLNFDESKNDNILFYKEYKDFIFGKLDNEIIKDMAEEDSKLKDSKKTNKKNKKKDKKKMKNEINENIIKEPKETIRNENAKTDNNKIEKIETKKDKQYKEPFLYQNKINKKVKKKSKKTNNKKNIQSKPLFLSNFQENALNSNDELIRIISKASISTLKSSNYQDLLSNYDDNLSMNEDFPTINYYKTPLNDENLISSTKTIKSINIEDTKISSNNKSDNNNALISSQVKKENNISEFKEKNEIIKIINNKKSFAYNNINNMNDIFDFHSTCPKSSDDMLNFFEIGINAYALKARNNVTILNEYKKDIVNIFICRIIPSYLKERYLLIFQIFGSVVTGTSIEGSDVDICISFKKLLNINQNFEKDLEYALKQNEHNWEGLNYSTENISSINRSRIVVKVDISEKIKKCPLDNDIKYLDQEDINTIKIDFTFYETEKYWENVNNVLFVNKLLNSNPEMRDVLLIIKRFLKNNGKNEVYLGGIGSFQLILMIYYVLLKLKSEFPYNTTKFNLLFMTFSIFSIYDFKNYAIDFDIYNNYCFDVAIENNQDIDRPFIKNPLTGENVAENASIKGKDINEIFKKGYDLLNDEYNYPKKYFNEGSRETINKNRPIFSITNLFSPPYPEK